MPTTTSGPIAAPVPANGDTARGRSSNLRRLGQVLILAGMAIIPWLYLLASHLPSTKTVSNWSTAWVGLDSLEALGLLATGSMLLRDDDGHRLAAAATGTLFVVDAWLDVTTASPGFERRIAVAMAAGGEAPLALLCWALALRRPSARRRDRSSGICGEDQTPS